MEETEIFKICLEYWNALASDLYRENPFPSSAPLLIGTSQSQTIPPRRQMYLSVLSKVSYMLSLCHSLMSACKVKGDVRNLLLALRIALHMEYLVTIDRWVVLTSENLWDVDCQTREKLESSEKIVNLIVLDCTRLCSSYTVLRWKELKIVNPTDVWISIRWSYFRVQLL